MQIKKIASARAASLSDSDESVRIPRRKKAKTGFLRSNKSPKRTHDRHHGIHSYCVMCNKAGMPDCKYTSHSAEDCTGVHTKRPIKDGMGGLLDLGFQDNGKPSFSRSPYRPSQKYQRRSKKPS